MATDMNNVEIKAGQKVRRWPLINQKEGEYKIRTVAGVEPMHRGGDEMVWFCEGGGAHHPKAVEVISDE
ncbi:hypothetical protein MASR1M48_17020 [Lactococcus petauri]